MELVKVKRIYSEVKKPNELDYFSGKLENCLLRSLS